MRKIWLVSVVAAAALLGAALYRFSRPGLPLQGERLGVASSLTSPPKAGAPAPAVPEPPAAASPAAEPPRPRREIRRLRSPQCTPPAGYDHWAYTAPEVFRQKAVVDEWFTHKVEPDILEIYFRRDATADDRERVFQALEAVEVEEEPAYYKDDNPNASRYFVKLPPGRDLRAALHSMEDEPSVLDMNPHLLDVRAIDEYPDDPEFPNNSAFDNTGQTGGVFDADIDAPEGWDIWSAPFMREIVAVIDSGIDRNHPELEACRWVNHQEYTGLPGVDDDGNTYVDDIYGWDFVDDDGDPEDKGGHGTKVAGVIAASAYNGQGTAGLCREIVVLPIRVFREDSGDIRDIEKAFDYAIDSGADVFTPASQTVTLRGANEVVPTFTGRPIPPSRSSGPSATATVPSRECKSPSRGSSRTRA